MNDINIGIETLEIAKNGNLSELVLSNERLNEHYQNLVEKEGLLDAHFTIKGGCTYEEKIDLLFEDMNSWGKKDQRTKITKL